MCSYLIGFLTLFDFLLFFGFELYPFLFMVEIPNFVSFQKDDQIQT